MGKKGEEKDFSYDDEKIDNVSIFCLKYQESAKVIDYCKSQQWQVAILILGFLFGFASIYIPWIHQNREKPNVAIIQIIFVLLLALITFIGLEMIRFLKKSELRHKSYIDMMDNYLGLKFLPKAKNISNHQSCDDVSILTESIKVNHLFSHCFVSIVLTGFALVLFILLSI